MMIGQLTNGLTDLVWLVTVVIGLAMSVLWRSRLGRAAAPAIAGFTVLLAIEAVDRLWSPRSGTAVSGGVLDILAAADPVDLTILLAVYVAYPVGLALLLIALLRAKVTEPVATEQ